MNYHINLNIESRFLKCYGEFCFGLELELSVIIPIEVYVWLG